MRVTHQIIRGVAGLCLAAGIPAVGFGQTDVAGGPLSGPPVLDAPFSADAATTAQQIRGDGTRVARTATARYYRDSAGRVRVEQVITGGEPLDTSAGRQVRVTVHAEPSQGWAYTLDPVTRSATKVPRSVAGLAVGGGNTFSVPLSLTRSLVFTQGETLRTRYGLTGADTVVEALGSRQLGGLQATGQRVTTMIPVGQWGNNHPMQIVDERWESAQLKLLIYSRHSDPRGGIVEYRLTNIRTVEPPPELFMIPADYTPALAAVGRGSIVLEYAEPPDPARPGRSGSDQSGG